MEALSQGGSQRRRLSGGKRLRLLEDPRDVVQEGVDDAMLMVSGDMVMVLFSESLDDIAVR